MKDLALYYTSNFILDENCDTSSTRQLHTERMEGLYTNIKPTQINICFPYVSLRQINVTLQNTYS